MDIAILHCNTAEVEVIQNCPDNWKSSDIENYLFNVQGYKDSEISYMAAEDIDYNVTTYEEE